MEAALVPADYVRAVSAAGGAPIMIPPGSSLPETLALVDGLVFSGGSDLDPSLYASDVHPETSGVIRERDDFELELMRAALERDVPHRDRRLPLTRRWPAVPCGDADQLDAARRERSRRLDGGNRGATRHAVPALFEGVGDAHGRPS